MKTLTTTILIALTLLFTACNSDDDSGRDTKTIFVEYEPDTSLMYIDGETYRSEDFDNAPANYDDLRISSDGNTFTFFSPTFDLAGIKIIDRKGTVRIEGRRGFVNIENLAQVPSGELFEFNVVFFLN